MSWTPIELEGGNIPRQLSTILSSARVRRLLRCRRSTPLCPSRPLWFFDALLLFGVGACLAGCKPQQPAGASVSQVSVERVPQVSYVLRNPEGPAAGYRVSQVAAQLHNPYGVQMGAVEEGRFLYVRMNCAYCHGFDGTGGMGPDLTDNQWRYGSSDADVFETIYRGRAQGMPAWGNVLTEDQIWKLVSYVRSLGTGAGGHKLGTRTADFTRKTSPNSLSR